MSLRKTLCILACFLPMTACAPDFDGDDYTTDTIGHMSTADKGEIVFKRKIKMRYDDERGGSKGASTGATIGGASGAMGGLSSGGSLGHGVAGGLIGSIIGAGIGYGIDQATRTHEGIEYHVMLEKNKEVVIVVQGPKPEMEINTKVLLIRPNQNEAHKDGSKPMRTRIIPAPY